MKILVFIIIFLLFTCNLQSQNYFIENRGQWKPTVRFVGQSAGYNVIVTDKDILIDVPDYSTLIKDSIQNHYKHSGCVYRLKIISDGSEKLMITNEIRGVNKQTTYFNYFIGNDSSKWFTRVPSFRSLEFKGSERDASFSLEISGKKLLLCYANNATHITDIQLVSDNKIPVSFNYSITKSKKITYTLDISDFVNFTNRNKKENKDEIQWDEHDDRNLVYSTYFGGAGDMYVDSEGYCYLTGSVDEYFPTTPGAYKEAIDPGTQSGFVSKLSPDGKDLLYSTYLCGEDAGSSLSSIKCDKKNNIYVGGEILSDWDYPVTENAFQKTGNGDDDFIITKLDPTGTKLLYSTYLGGTEDEDGRLFIGVDDEENIYLAGITRSKDYPLTDNCLKDTISGEKDIVITKISSITGKLIYSTYLGSRSNSDFVTDIFLDSLGCIYLCGWGVLEDFPVTEGVFKDHTELGKSAAFISKLNKNGDSLIFSSFFGGNSLLTEILSLDVAANGNIFIVGITRSEDFPVTSEDIGIRPKKYENLYTTSYITELDPKCSYIVHSTCINNRDIKQLTGLCTYNIDFDGKCAWISGTYESYEGIIEATEGAFQKNGEYFFMKVSSDFRKILYLSYIEDCHNEYEDILHNITDMDIINGSLLYLTGTTNNLDFPTSPDSFQHDYTVGVGARAFVMKFDMTTVGVGEEQPISKNELINIFPNPASYYIEINMGRWTPSVRWSPSDLTIFNSLGECIINESIHPMTSSHRMNIEHLPPGLYLISINNGKEMLTGSFIVVR